VGMPPFQSRHISSFHWRQVCGCLHERITALIIPCEHLPVALVWPKASCPEQLLFWPLAPIRGKASRLPRLLPLRSR
jgi:hypothetical protein